jgi:hypothetical protein
MRRRDLRPAARADLLWLAIGFVVLQIALAVVSRYRMPELRDPTFAYKSARLHNRLANTDRPLTILALGSSRTAFGLRGEQLEARIGPTAGRPIVAFNFGQYGAGPLTELVALRRLLADGVRPDLVLAEVPPFYLAGQPGANGELGLLHYTRLERDELPLMEHCGASSDDLRRDWWQANLVPWYGYRLAVLSRFAPKWLPAQAVQDFGTKTDAAGWAPLAAKRPAPEEMPAIMDGMKRQFDNELTNFQLGGASCTALRDLLTLCRSERIPVALLLMPESNEFRALYSPNALAQIDTFLTGLSREFAAPLLDARGWVADNGFSDGHHLLPEGATVFTDRLGPVVQRLLTPTAVAAGPNPAGPVP